MSDKIINKLNRSIGVLSWLVLAFGVIWIVGRSVPMMLKVWG